MDLIMLSMKEFDVILGIDWQTRFHDTMDCVDRSITFSISGTQSFTFQCNPLSDAFLTTHLAAIEGTSMETTIAQIPIVRRRVSRYLQFIPAKID